MDPLTRLLVRRVVDRDGPLPLAERRARLSLLEGWASVVINVALFALKLALGLATGSVALLADAVHTVADSATSAIVILSARLARRPPDPRHPFGYGRIESVSSVVIAVLLGVAALEFGKAAITRLIHPEPVEAGWFALLAIAATIPVKLWLAMAARSLGREAGSTMLEADAWHHATDVLATVPVLVTLGAGLVTDHPPGWLDGAMGLLVAAVIGWAAWDLARDATRPLLGEAPTPEEIAEIEAQASSVPGVRGVHDIVVHKYGHLRVVSLHVETTGDMSAIELHDLAERVEEKVAHGHHGEVVVHVDPVDTTHPAYEEVRAILEAAAAEEPRLEALHDIRVFGTLPKLEVTADASTRETLSPAEQRRILDRLADRLARRFPGARLRAHFDPVFAIRPPLHRPDEE